MIALMVRLLPVATTLSTPDADRLASFYAELLGWERTTAEDGWVVIANGDALHRIAFHGDEEFVAPVWPSRADRPQMQVHLEIATDDLGAAVEHAVARGATVADHQPQDDVRVMLDPDGHPFCLFEWDGIDDVERA